MTFTVWIVGAVVTFMVSSFILGLGHDKGEPRLETFISLVLSTLLSVA